MAQETNRQDSKAGRQIVGFSLSPGMAAQVKTEAARRGLTLKKLFEEMWKAYEHSDKSDK